jgi:membrane protease YdiL (CAAX protease family)
MVERSLPGRALAAAVLAAAVLAADVPPPDPRLTLGVWTVPAAVIAGLVLFATLARRPPRLPPLRRGRRRVLAAATAYLSIRSAYEELLWRGALLGALLHVLAPLPAIALSLVPWTLTHWRRQRRAALAHVATGSTFAGLFWATGTLAAPIAAHASYNLAVCFGGERARARADPHG